jgi:hypothetical protein
MLKGAAFVISAVAFASTFTSAFSIQHSALQASPETLRSVAAIPAHIAGRFRDIAACHLSPDGDYLVFDRRSHSVSLVPKGGEPREIVQIGIEPGRILGPLAFDSAPDGTFVIADAPFGAERVQAFYYRGGATGGFSIPGRSTPRVALGDLVLSGVGSIQYTGRSVLVSQPHSGALITEYAMDGRVLRTFGQLRSTGHEQERDLHLALNAGLPIVLPNNAGFYFVFLSGVPVFRKYDASGGLVFERHIEGLELDKHIQSLPGIWPHRKTRDGEFPIVPPTVRAAGVDPDGNLWVSLAVPFTYVYDTAGDKRRTVQFQAAGTLAPTNFYFSSDGRIVAAPGCYAFKR